jgi:hypothetical protein
MGEISIDLVMKRLDDVLTGQRVMDGKIGVLAESMVSMRKGIDDIAQEVGGTRLEVHNLRADVRTIAIAVDQHTTRLDEIEKHFGIGTPAN